MKLLAFDIETTVRNQPKFSNIVLADSFPANPYHKDNKLVLGAFMNPINAEYEEWDEWPANFITDGTVIAGHNLSFDLTYAIRDNGIGYIKGLKIWDTQLAEYMLTGQQVKMIGLDKLAQRYGIPGKLDKVKEWWEAGYDTTDIPHDILSEYLKQDVDITGRIALLQIEKAKRLGMYQIILDRNRSLIATTIMSFVGIWFDLEKLNTLITETEQKVNKLKGRLLLEMSSRFNPDGIVRFEPNLDSPKQVTAFLFGGEAGYYKTDVPVIDEETGEPVKYKTGARKGQVKTKKVKVTVIVENPLVPDWQGEQSSTDDTLAALAGKHELIDVLREYRHVNKELIMYKSYLEYALSDKEGYGVIHPRFNHTITATGRLSSSNPNVQNISNKGVD